LYIIPNDNLKLQYALYDIVDPVDFEECVSQGKTRSYEGNAYSSWNVRQFSDFPADDLELKIIAREQLYKDPILPIGTNVYVLL